MQQHKDRCPVSGDPAYLSTKGEFLVYRCPRCGQFRLLPEDSHALRLAPPSAEQVAAFAGFNREHGQGGVTITSSTVTGRMYVQWPMIQRVCRKTLLLRRLHDRFDDDLFQIDFADPDLLGVSYSQGANDLRDLVDSMVRGGSLDLWRGRYAISSSGHSALSIVLQLRRGI